MQLQHSFGHYFLPNETYKLSNFTLETGIPYLIIVGAEYASTAHYIGITSILALTPLAVQELMLRSSYIIPAALSSSELTIQYTPPEGLGAQVLYINSIRLS